jgi:tetratricopeptide (TPR) repeat protein
MQHVQTLRTLRDLGRAYERVGRKEDAQALYRESLANLPTTPDDADGSRTVLFTVGWLLTRDTGEFQDSGRAVEFAQRAVDVAMAKNARDRYMNLDLLALAQYQSGDIAKAIETQKRAIEAIPKRVNQAVRNKYETHLRTYQDALKE